MKAINYIFGGMIFGAGLALSGMVQPEIVLSFLLLEDLGLLLVMLSAIAITLTGFWIIPKIMKTSTSGEPFRLRKQHIDKNLVFGSAIFGVGWGIAGLCPGAAIASIGTGNLPVLWGLFGILLGTYGYGWYVRLVRKDNY